ncbi:MAG: universal stress protein [Solirubrobacteraceae bacterium]
MDGFGGGDDAVALAKALGGSHAKLTLTHVLTSAPLADSGNGAIRESRSIEEFEHVVALLGEARAKERSRHVGIGITVQSTDREWLALGLGEIAQAHEADLVVIGSSRQALFRHVLLSKETQAALNGLRCSVAVAPAGLRIGLGAIQRVGVGSDGPNQAVQAIELARRVAETHDAHLFACFAMWDPMMAVGGAALPIDDAVREGERDAVQRADHAEPHVAYGSPAEVLGKFSGALDLLVIGSRAGGAFGEVAVGETFNELTRHVCCPVLVPPGEIPPTQMDRR